MKILYISYGGLGETERVQFRQYVKQGVALEVIVPSKIAVNKVYSSSGYLAYDPNDHEQGFSFTPVDVIKSGYINSFNPFKLFQAIKKARPDVIHIYDDFSSYYVTEAIICRNLLYGRKVPIVVHALQNHFYKDRPFFSEFSVKGIKLLINKLLQPMLFAYHNKNVGGVTSLGTEGLDVVKSVGFKGPTRCIYSGVSRENFYPKDKKDCRRKLGIPEDIKLVGYIGRLVETKGITTLVRAVSQMPDWHLLLVGSGHKGDSYEAQLNSLIASLPIKDRMYRFGSVDNKKLVDYYNCLNVFVLPSETHDLWKEQYSMALTEAMFSGLAVVGSSSSAIPKRLEGYPLHLIFKERDVNDLSAKIEEVLKLQIPEGFDMEKMLYPHTAEHFAKAHIDLYNLLINKLKL